MRNIDRDDSCMRSGDLSREELVLIANSSELALLSNALNEAFEAIEEWEFGTRLGVTSEEARVLQYQIGEILRDRSTHGRTPDGP